MAPASAMDIGTVELMETGEVLVQSCSEDEPPAAALYPQRFRRFSGKHHLLLAAMGAVSVVVVVATLANRHPPRADVDATAQLFGAAALATGASTMAVGAKVMQDIGNGPTKAANYTNIALGPLSALKARVNAKPNVSQLLVDLPKMNHLTKKEMLNRQDTNDGNLCADDEELHLSLCYKKCSALTQGKYPIRTTAFSCCQERPCSYYNSKFTNALHYCAGFDVSGSHEGEGCPHPPGACMANEEFHLGVCYKKCAILTGNKFPYRSGAGTCCRYKSLAACIDALSTESSTNFTVGGGLDDGHPSTPNQTHPAMQSLTESDVPTGVDVGA